MSKLVQLSVFAQNKPGKIEKITGILAREDINILAITISGSDGFGIIKLIVDDTARAEAVLKKSGVAVSLNEVLAIELVDRPGGLFQVMQALARTGINIENANIFIPLTREKAYLVVEVENLKKTKKILEKEGLPII